jgi:glycosyltransferase involved in cell wall biosynthesis
MVALTIGMATYNDFDGVYFTLQALRLYQDLDNTELLVIDNYGCDTTKDFVKNWTNGRYIRATELAGTAAPRDLVFREARGKAVLCCDSHILFAPGVIAKLKAYYRAHPKTNDLLQGPILMDDLTNIATHFKPEWRDQMWGTWDVDPRGKSPKGKPFDIPMQGLGIFSCRKKAWPGFNPAFRGFGGEEGYIHEKIRQRGGRTLCLPWLRWVHRFARPRGVPYPLSIEDKLRNYLIGHAELGLDLEPILDHFAEHMSPAAVARVKEQALQSARGKGKKPKKLKKDKKRKSQDTPPDLSVSAAPPSPALAPQEQPLRTVANTPPSVGLPAEPASSNHREPAALLSSPETEAPENEPHAVNAFVFGLTAGADVISEANPSIRAFPLLSRQETETGLSHVARIARLVEQAIASGGTYLLIPTQAADWLDEHPLATEYFSTHLQPLAASFETGMLFALSPPAPLSVEDQEEPAHLGNAE